MKRQFDAEAQIHALRAMPAEEVIPHLIDLLGARDSCCAAFARQVLASIGKACVPALITAALKPRRRESHALALLETVALVGEPLALLDLCRLLTSAGTSRRPALRNKCFEVVMRLRSAAKSSAA